jgi:hypothetical protein
MTPVLGIYARGRDHRPPLRVDHRGLVARRRPGRLGLKRAREHTTTREPAIELTRRGHGRRRAGQQQSQRADHSQHPHHVPTAATHLVTMLSDPRALRITERGVNFRTIAPHPLPPIVLCVVTNGTREDRGYPPRRLVPYAPAASGLLAGKPPRSQIAERRGNGEPRQRRCRSGHQSIRPTALPPRIHNRNGPQHRPHLG